MSSDQPCHLSVILDLSPTQWYLSSLPPPANEHELGLPSFISQFLAFINSHIALKHENTLAVFGALPGKSLMLYSSTDPDDEEQMAQVDANSYRPFKVADNAIMSRISEEMDALGELDEEAPCELVGALTKSLCYINRVTLPAVSTASTSTPNRNHELILADPRILILSVSPDLSTSYIPIMNAIFSAQKLKVAIDVCKIYGPDTVFLQQAAHLTGGSYIHLEKRDALLQYLIMSHLSPPSIRMTLSVPTQDKIDFRAACFCHKTIIDVGFVCSVCLSIFCQPVPVCSTCRSKFPIKTLQRLNASRPAVAQLGSSSQRATSTTPGSTPLTSNSHAPTPNGRGGLPNSAHIGLTANMNGSSNGAK